MKKNKPSPVLSELLRESRIKEEKNSHGHEALESSKSERKHQLSLGHLILEFKANETTSVDEEKPVTSLKRGAPRKAQEDKVKAFKVLLAPKYLEKFHLVQKAQKFKHHKTFGNSKKLMSLLDRLDDLEEREFRRVHMLKKLLQDFNKIRRSFESVFKRADRSPKTQEYLQQLTKKFKTIHYVFYVLAMSEQELKEYLNQEERDALTLALYMTKKEEAGELKLS